MKFLHTADWQIGMKAAHVGAAGEAVRRARLESLHRLTALANERRVDFVLVAGDCFEDNGVDRVLVQKTVDAIGKCASPVYIIPGNHDPVVPGSVWESPVWRKVESIRVLTKAEPIPIPGGILHPCPLTEKHSRRDPTAWIRPTEGEGIRIGLGHGTVEGVSQDEPDHPIPRDAAERSGLDYLALGHWHSTAYYEVEPGFRRMAYSGTHETTKFGERDSGNVLLVEIDERGAPPRIESIRCGRLEWLRLDRELREEGDAGGLLEEIEAIRNPESVLLQATVSGLLPAADRHRTTEIATLLASRFLHHVFDASGVRPSPEDEAWVSELPVGVIQETGRRLAELADPAYPGPRPESASPAIAARALLELYALAGEVRR